MWWALFTHLVIRHNHFAIRANVWRLRFAYMLVQSSLVKCTLVKRNLSLCASPAGLPNKNWLFYSKLAQTCRNLYLQVGFTKQQMVKCKNSLSASLHTIHKCKYCTNYHLQIRARFHCLQVILALIDISSKEMRREVVETWCFSRKRVFSCKQAMFTRGNGYIQALSNPC